MTGLPRPRPPDPRDPPSAAMARAEALALIALADESAASMVHRSALVLRLSLLPESLARPHHRRLAQEALLPLRDADRAVLFRLPNGDTALVWRQAGAEAIERCLAALRLLFAGEIEPDFLLSLLTLPADSGRLRGVAEASLRHAAPAPVVVAEPRMPLDPATVAALEAALAQTGMARFMRRQAVCADTAEGFALRWEHRHIDVAELAETMVPGRDIQADPWLFRRLCGVLDRRVLALLAAAGELREAGPFSLDLNVSTLLGPEFLRFDNALPARLRGQVVIAIRPPGLLADPEGFCFARDFLRSRGYRVALGGLSMAQTGVFDRQNLGLDLVFLRFSPPKPGFSAPIGDAERVILCQVDTPEARAWGKMRGILQFQGRMAVPMSHARMPMR